MYFEILFKRSVYCTVALSSDLGSSFLIYMFCFVFAYVFFCFVFICVVSHKYVACSVQFRPVVLLQLVVTASQGPKLANKDLLLLLL